MRIYEVTLYLLQHYEYDEESNSLLRIIHKYHDRSGKASDKCSENRNKRKHCDQYAHRERIWNSKYRHRYEEHKSKYARLKALSRYKLGESPVCQHTCLDESVCLSLLEHSVENPLDLLLKSLLLSQNITGKEQSHQYINNCSHNAAGYRECG